MSKRRSSNPILNSRVSAGVGLCLVATWLGMLSFAAPSSSSSSAANIRAGDPVTPGEFHGDLRNLPQAITEEERKSFLRPMELDYPVPAIKQMLPGVSAAQNSAASINSTAPMAPMP